MSSASSLETTAASDESTSSSADSACSSDVTIHRSFNSSKLRHRRDEPYAKPNYIAKLQRPSVRRVVCRCRACAGARMVSRSTRYRHLRVESEMAEDDAKWEARWSFSLPSQLWLFRPAYQC